MPEAERLTIKQTHTGYWVVQRGGVQLAGAMTREAAERERETLRRIGARRLERGLRRSARPPATRV